MWEKAFPNVVIVQGPAIQPVTLHEVRRHCRIDGNEEDDVLTRQIPRAVGLAEGDLGRALITQTIDVTFPGFSNRLYIPRPPLQSVTSVTYTDTAGDAQVLDSSIYRVLTNVEPGEVRLEYGQTWPDTYEVEHEVTIRCVVGYGALASDVPEAIKAGILFQVGHLFENREQTAPGIEIREIAVNARDYWADYRVRY
jgi:uncharacterized phiE125 gp8 family phage protein